MNEPLDPPGRRSRSPTAVEPPEVLAALADDESATMSPATVNDEPPSTRSALSAVGSRTQRLPRHVAEQFGVVAALDAPAMTAPTTTTDNAVNAAAQSLFALPP